MTPACANLLDQKQQIAYSVHQLRHRHKKEVLLLLPCVKVGKGLQACHERLISNYAFPKHTNLLT